MCVMFVKCLAAIPVLLKEISGSFTKCSFYHVILASNTFCLLLATTDNPLEILSSQQHPTPRVLRLGCMKTKEVSEAFYLGITHSFMECIRIRRYLIPPPPLEFILKFLGSLEMHQLKVLLKTQTAILTNSLRKNNFKNIQ